MEFILSPNLFQISDQKKILFSDMGWYFQLRWIMYIIRADQQDIDMGNCKRNVVLLVCGKKLFTKGIDCLCEKVWALLIHVLFVGSEDDVFPNNFLIGIYGRFDFQGLWQELRYMLSRIAGLTSCLMAIWSLMEATFYWAYSIFCEVYYEFFSQ